MKIKIHNSLLKFVENKKIDKEYKSFFLSVSKNLGIPSIQSKTLWQFNDLFGKSEYRRIPLSKQHFFPEIFALSININLCLLIGKNRIISTKSLCCFENKPLPLTFSKTSDKLLKELKEVNTEE